MRLDDQDPAAAPTRIRRCGKCRYPLAKLPAVGRCPACGETFGVDLDPFDHVCLGCGYDLQGLTDDASCPECGLAIARSQLGDALVHSSPAYVRALQRGAGIALVGAASWIICPIAGVVVLACIYSPAPDPSPYFQTVALATLGTIPVGLVLAIAGLWRMSIPDPLAIIRDRGNRPRKTLRISLAISVGLGVLQVLIGLGLMLLSSLQASYLAESLAKLVLIASIATVLVSAASYIAWLARRLGARQLQESASRLRIFGGVVGGLSAIAWLSGPCVGLLSLPFVLTTLILYCGLLVELRRYLRQVCQLAPAPP